MLLCSCAIGPVNGLVFSDTSFPGDVNPRGDVEPIKTGKSCQSMYLGLLAIGDAGAGEAARQAGIKRIATIDHENFSLLTLVYNRYCTTVTGE